MIAAGERAPEFKLLNQDLNRVKLSELLENGRVLLCFYPGDWSPVCSDQLSVYQEVISEIEDRGVQLVGISVDGVFCHQAFRKHLNLTMPLLADFHPKGRVSALYGAYREDLGFDNRSLVLIDADGTVAWSHESPSDLEIPGANLIFDALDG